VKHSALSAFTSGTNTFTMHPKPPFIQDGRASKTGNGKPAVFSGYHEDNMVAETSDMKLKGSGCELRS
jgi:hypothetical protein